MLTEFAASITNYIFAGFFSSLGTRCLLAQADSVPHIVLALYRAEKREKEDGPGSRASPTFLEITYLFNLPY
jgi:hypothetical protein